MLKRLTIFFAFILTIHMVKGEIVSLSGVYKGLNLYVENDSLQGESCVMDVFVNDQRIDFEKAQHFFEIDMSFLKLEQHVSVKIICTSGCKAKVLNPEVINLMYGFQFMSLNLEQDKIIWTSTNEKPGGKYIVELHLHKQWVAVGEVTEKPSKVVNFYENKQETLKHLYYRVRYVDKEGVSHSSQPIKFHHHHE